MAERVFCVDFGSAYTKVALRRDPTADSALLACAGADVDFWVPTVVAVDRRGADPRLEFGDRAADLRSGGGIDVYTNFKKDLFTAPTSAPGKPVVSPLDALLQSEEFVTLAARYGVQSPQVAALRSMAAAARTLVAGPGERVVSLEGHRQANAVKLVYNFFLWLRKQVLDACARLPASGLKFEDFPVRVTVPAVAPSSDLASHPSCKLLREALHRAGWPLHAEQPFVAEPEANAIGILTKAANALTRSGRVNLGQMFNKGPLITVMKGDHNYPTYRALVIDVGAYTTDLAALFIDTGGNPVETADGAGFGVTQRSVPFGVSDLDQSVRAALPPDKKAWLESAPHKEFQTFQRTYSGESKGYRVAGLGVIGGEPDRPALSACLDQFTQRLTDEVTKFCAALPSVSMQELVLTGGGNNIPAVRDALIAAAQTGGVRFVKTHAPDLKRGKAGAPLVDKLDETFARGGSALGGASLYFERSYY
ncbi:acetate and sugar kinases/Hsc70/actin family protein [Frigoriglobus tundricola]|uniref:Uncharacterized protein n=1 Tax=Frigoriglobus tundricola TaxID=2774151 RepID=A0A6M5Z3P0_9BACT|nr:hypothetical protein [Frigoriglobus tundricola]QJX00084.1 hypothetical protein FTUN_7708 [Frigoriglobus tundricola]